MSTSKGGSTRVQQGPAPRPGPPAEVLPPPEVSPRDRTMWIVLVVWMAAFGLLIVFEGVWLIVGLF